MAVRLRWMIVVVVLAAAVRVQGCWVVVALIFASHVRVLGHAGMLRSGRAIVVPVLLLLIRQVLVWLASGCAIVVCIVLLVVRRVLVWLASWCTVVIDCVLLLMRWARSCWVIVALVPTVPVRTLVRA